MRRRELLAVLVGGAGVLPVTARSQSGERARRRLGVLIEFAEADPEAQARLAALRSGLDARGWKEGDNLQSDVRFGSGNAGRIQSLATELAASAPDVILGSGAPVTAALQRATLTSPDVV